jgi:putative phosphoesterase
MKILVISDLHANWPALEAVLTAEPFDRLVVGGDLVSYGPHPREVVDAVSRHATLVVRGNHDEALARRIECGCSPSNRPLANATQRVHHRLLSTEELGVLGALPKTARLDIGGQALFAVHAAPRDELYSYALTPAAPDDVLERELGEVTADYIVLGHTHLPMVRRLGSRLVLNPGSVGQPRDGDPRASYAVIEDGVVTLRRAAYDIDRTARDIRALGLEAPLAERLVAILATGGA